MFGGEEKKEKENDMLYFQFAFLKEVSWGLFLFSIYINGYQKYVSCQFQRRL